MFLFFFFHLSFFVCSSFFFFIFPSFFIFLFFCSSLFFFISLFFLFISLLFCSTFPLFLFIFPSFFVCPSFPLFFVHRFFFHVFFFFVHLLFVKACPMYVDRTRTRMQQQSSSQRVGALSLIPSCLGISGHPSGSRQGHPRYTGARSAGRPWVARTQFSTAVQCGETPKYGSGA